MPARRAAAARVPGRRRRRRSARRHTTAHTRGRGRLADDSRGLRRWGGLAGVILDEEVRTSALVRRRSAFLVGGAHREPWAHPHAAALASLGRIDSADAPVIARCQARAHRRERSDAAAAVGPHGLAGGGAPANNKRMLTIGPDKLGLRPCTDASHCFSPCLTTALAAGSAQQRSPQYRVPPVGDLSGAPGLAMALRKLNTVGTLMQATAHPDDENNAMLALVRAERGHARGAGVGDARRRRAERDRPGAVRCARRPAHRRAAGGAPVRRRRAVLHPRRGLRLLVQPRGNARRSGAGPRFSATSSGTSGPCGPTSSSRSASTARAEASTIRPRR